MVGNTQISVAGVVAGAYYRIPRKIEAEVLKRLNVRLSDIVAKFICYPLD